MTDDQHDLNIKPGPQRLDKIYGGAVLLVIALFGICCYSYTHHWINVGISAVTALSFLALFLAFSAYRLAKDKRV